MSSTISHIPFAEFEHNPVRVFRRVTDEYVTVVVEDEAGKKIVVHPGEKAKPTHRRGKKTNADYAAFLAAAGSWSDVDTDALIKRIYAGRTISSHPPVAL